MGAVEHLKTLCCLGLKPESAMIAVTPLLHEPRTPCFRAWWHTAAITMRLIVEGCLPFAGGIIGVGGELDRPDPDQVLIEILLLARSGSSALIA